jgi:hypothetical protein
MHMWLTTHSALTPGNHSSGFADQLAVTIDFPRTPRETKCKAGRLTLTSLPSRNIEGGLYQALDLGAYPLA